MPLALTLSYVVHVVSAALWTGGVLYAAYAVFPPARGGDLSPPAFERSVDGLLQVTRWTGIALPVTGAYQIWVLYPTDRLLGTTAGHLVVGMALLWSVMNGVVELGVYRMRTLDGEALGVGRYMAEGFALDGDADLSDVVDAAGTGRPYVLAAAGLAVLLLVDAGLLAAGVPL